MMFQGLAGEAFKRHRPVWGDIRWEISWPCGCVTRTLPVFDGGFNVPEEYTPDVDCLLKAAGLSRWGD